MGARFVPRQEVWVQPSSSNANVLHDDVGTIIEDFGTCYLVIQEDELMFSDGAGWVVTDQELQLLRQ